MSERSPGHAGMLARLDRLVVPVLQRAARGAAHGLGAPLRALGRWEARLASGRLLAALWSRRSGLLLLTVVVAVAGSAVHFQRFPELAGSAPGAGGAPGRPAGTPPAGTLPGADTVVVGPTDGAGVEAYVAERRAVLEASPPHERRLAVVSFAAFTAAAAAADLVPASVTLHRVQYRLPDVEAHPTETAVDGGELVATMERVLAAEREVIVAEEEEVGELLSSGTVEDEAFLADLESRAEELKTVRNLLDSGAAVVFALVVEGSVEDLRGLQGRAGVRLVDLAPPEAVVEGSAFYGLLPDDRDEVTHGAPAPGAPGLGDR